MDLKIYNKLHYDEVHGRTRYSTEASMDPPNVAIMFNVYSQVVLC